jgi:hypothetical protein
VRAQAFASSKPSDDDDDAELLLRRLLGLDSIPFHAPPEATWKGERNKNPRLIFAIYVARYITSTSA